MTEEIDIGSFAEALNNKADIDFANTSYPNDKEILEQSIDTKANDEDVVHKTGDEKIAGSKGLKNIYFQNFVIMDGKIYTIGAYHGIKKGLEGDTSSYPEGIAIYYDDSTSNMVRYGEPKDVMWFDDLTSFCVTPSSSAKSNEVVTAEWVLNKIYPVGSIYTSVNNTNPSSLFGGTWQSIGSGRVLQGVGSGQTAGNTVEAGLPNITGSFPVAPGTNDTDKYSGAFTKGASFSGNGTNSQPNYKVSFNASNSNSIYGKSSTVQPPAYLVYFWRRTA